jgi:hypothetical protein
MARRRHGRWGNRSPALTLSSRAKRPDDLSDGEYGTAAKRIMPAPFSKFDRQLRATDGRQPRHRREIRDGRLRGIHVRGRVLVPFDEGARYCTSSVVKSNG